MTDQDVAKEINATVSKLEAEQKKTALEYISKQKALRKTNVYETNAQMLEAIQKKLVEIQSQPADVLDLLADVEERKKVDSDKCSTHAANMIVSKRKSEHSDKNLFIDKRDVIRANLILAKLGSVEKLDNNLHCSKCYSDMIDRVIDAK